MANKQQVAPYGDVQPWRRALVAGALAIVLFTLISVPTWLLIPYGTDPTLRLSGVGYFALLLIILLVTPAVALGLAFTAGQAVERRTAGLSPGRAAAWFAQLAAAPAVLAMLAAFLSGPVSSWLPFVNLVLPAAAAGALSRLLVDKVLGSRLATMIVLFVTVIVASAPLMLFVLIRVNGV